MPIKVKIFESRGQYFVMYKRGLFWKRLTKTVKHSIPPMLMTAFFSTPDEAIEAIKSKFNYEQLAHKSKLVKEITIDP